MCKNVKQKNYQVSYLYGVKHKAEKEIQDKKDAEPVPEHEFNKKIAERKQNVSDSS